MIALFLRIRSRRAWDQSALEDPVCAIKKHIGSKLLFSSLEIRQDGNIYFIEVDYHKHIFIPTKLLKNLMTFAKVP